MQSALVKDVVGRGKRFGHRFVQIVNRLFAFFILVMLHYIPEEFFIRSAIQSSRILHGDSFELFAFKSKAEHIIDLDRLGWLIASFTLRIKVSSQPSCI